MRYWNGIMGCSGWLGVLLGALAVTAFILILIFIFKRTNIKPHDSTEKPLDILKMRYAKGEITKEEFEEAKELLNK